MKKFVAIGLIVVTAVLSMTGCQSISKQYGGTVNIDIPAGHKFVSGSWDEGHNYWYATRPMRSDEQPETVTVYESSNYGVLQGKIIITEHK